MNKWLSIGVTPSNILTSLPKPSQEIRTETYKARGSKGGSKTAPNSKRKDFAPRVQQIFDKFGYSEFSYKDLIELFSITRFAADKFLLMLRRRTTILGHRKAPRTSRGNTPGLYHLKPGWEIQLPLDLAAFNKSNPILTNKNTQHSL